MTILHPLVRTSPAATTSTSARGSRLPRPCARGTTPSAPCLWKASSDGVPLPRNGREATSPLVHGHPSRRRARRLSECEAVLARMSAMTAGWSCSLKCDSPAACLLVIISPVRSPHVLPWRVRCAAPSKNNKKRAKVLLKLAAAQGHERLIEGVWPRTRAASSNPSAKLAPHRSSLAVYGRSRHPRAAPTRTKLVTFDRWPFRSDSLRGPRGDMVHRPSGAPSTAPTLPAAGLNAPADRLLKSGWFRRWETESFYASRQI